MLDRKKFKRIFFLIENGKKSFVRLFANFPNQKRCDGHFIIRKLTRIRKSQLKEQSNLKRPQQTNKYTEIVYVFWAYA